MLEYGLQLFQFQRRGYPEHSFCVEAADEGKRLVQETRSWVEERRSKLPELPEARRDRFETEYGLPLYDANLLTSSKAMADYFEDCLKTEWYKELPPDKGAKEVSNWLLG